MKQLSPKLLMTTAGTLLFLLVLCGLSIVLFINGGPNDDYPNGTVVEGIGRCGTAEWVQRGRSLRREEYRCVLTTDKPGDVWVWYLRKGYTPRNGGIVWDEKSDRVFTMFRLERIYPLEQKDGTVMVRIYEDTTIRAPVRQRN